MKVLGERELTLWFFSQASSLIPPYLFTHEGITWRWGFAIYDSHAPSLRCPTTRRETAANSGQARGRARHGVGLHFRDSCTTRAVSKNRRDKNPTVFHENGVHVEFRPHDTRIHACTHTPTLPLISINTHHNHVAAAASCSTRRCSPALLETAPSSPAFRVFHLCSGSTAWTMASSWDRFNQTWQHKHTDGTRYESLRAITRVRVLHSPTWNYRTLLCAPAATVWPGAIVTRETAHGGDKGSDWRRNDVCSERKMEYWKGKIASGCTDRHVERGKSEN